MKSAIAKVTDAFAASADSTVNAPDDVAFDSWGDIFIAETGKHEIRCIAAVSTANACFQSTPTVGTIYTVAGVGNTGSAGDNAAATSAHLASPQGIAVDANRNLFIADTGNHEVRMVWAGGSNEYAIPTTYSISAGTETVGYIYRVAGAGLNVGLRWRRARATANGSKLNTPTDLTVDSSGNLFIADQGNQRIRKVTTGDTFSTVAGNGSAGYVADNVGATTTSLDNPQSVAVDSAGDLFIGDKTNNRIREVFATGGHAYGQTMTNGDIYTIAGTGTAGTDADGTTATSAKISAPWGVDVDSAGDVVFGDNGNDLVRVVAATTASHFGVSMTANKIYTIGGNSGATTYVGDGYPQLSTNSANINAPMGVAIDPTNTSNVWVIATNDILQEIDGTNGYVFTKAGQAGTATNTGDGSQSASWEVGSRYHEKVDSSGNVYFADPTGNRIREYVASTGEVITWAGTGGTGGAYSGGTFRLQLPLTGPDGVTIDGSGNIVIADTGDNKVAVVGSVVVSNVIGNGTACTTSCGDGAGSGSAKLNAPRTVAVDSAGDIYISDTGDCVVREVYEGGNAYNIHAIYGGSHPVVGDIYTIAGTLGSCDTGVGTGDSGLATSAKLTSNDGIDVDSSGNLYIAEGGGWRVRCVAAGTGARCGQANATANDIYTMAGSSVGSTGNGGAATSAKLSSPKDVAWDGYTNVLYIADSGNNEVRCVTTSVLGNGCGQASPSANFMYLIAGLGSGTAYGGWAQTPALSVPDGLSFTSGLDLYVSLSGTTDLQRIYGPNP